MPAAFIPVQSGYKKRTDAEELRLRVQMLNSTHLQAIAQKASDELGERYDKIGPLDFTRNPLVRYVTALATAYAVPAGISGAPAGLLDMLGGERSRPLVRRYKAADYRPMPVEMARVSADVERYVIACHYCGALVGWSKDDALPFLDTITPDTLRLTYRLDNPRRPSVYEHDLRRPVDGRLINVTDVYDVSDPRAPIYRTLSGKRDVTAAAHPGTGLTGQNWPDDWRLADGAPRVPIAVYGRPNDLTRLLELVEATLRISVGYSWWWAGFRDACFKGRNVRGMHLAGLDSAMDAEGGGKGGSGIATGSEDVLRWIDDDGDKAGEHWQWDAPFDAKAMEEALQGYETNAFSQLAVPVDLTKTGGEPLAHEIEARRIAAMRHYDDMRAGDADVLRLVAMLANRNNAGKFNEAAKYGLAYNEEITEEIAAAAAKPAEVPPVEETDNERGEQDGPDTGSGDGVHGEDGVDARPAGESDAAPGE